MITFQLAATFIFPALMLVAAFYDLLTMRIPNLLVGIVAAAFLILAFVAGMSLTDIGMHVLAGIAVLVVTFTMFALGWIGGGDAKLAAAIAVWFGFDLLLPFLLYAALAGGVLTVLILLARRAVLPASLFQIGWIEKLHNPKTGIPYGIALAAAALFVYPQSAIIDLATPVVSSTQSLFEQLQAL
jgi:prepilin peptidase CpaA